MCTARDTLFVLISSASLRWNEVKEDLVRNSGVGRTKSSPLNRNIPRLSRDELDRLNMAVP